MHGKPRSIGWLALVATALPCLANGASVVQTEQVRAELLAHAPEGIAPGKPLWLGLKLEHIPHWHTYWKNAGDSGLPTNFSWTLPAGLSAGDIDWPTPKQLPIGPLLNFGYDGTVLLPVPVTVTAPVEGGTLHVRLEADWLVCKIECIPQSGSFRARPAHRHSRAAHRPRISTARSPRGRLRSPAPRPRRAWTTVRWPSKCAACPSRCAAGTRPCSPRSRASWTIPRPVQQAWDGDRWQARWPLSAQRSASPAELPLVLAFDGGRNLRVIASVTAWPDSVATGAAPGIAGQDAGVALNQPGFLTALLFALLGGVILNLMPCVFPVLSLKVLSLTQHAGSRARALEQRAGLHRGRGAGLPGAGRPADRGARRRRTTGLGISIAGARHRRRARGAVHAHRPESRRRVRIRLHAAIRHRQPARARSDAGFLPDGRTRRGGGLALHRTVHGRRAGSGAHLAAGAEPVGVRRARARGGRALSIGERGARDRPLAATARDAGCRPSKWRWHFRCSPR